MRLALYGMPGLDEAGHDGCSIAQFCRNPLHPGPCKGWRRAAGVLDSSKASEPKPKAPSAPRPRKAAAPAVPKKTGPRDGDGDGILNEGGYEKKGRAPGKGDDIPSTRLTAGKPGTKPSTPWVGALSDQKLVRGVEMHGTEDGEGKTAADELRRRGLDMDGRPAAAGAQPKPAPAPTPRPAPKPAPGPVPKPQPAPGPAPTPKPAPKPAAARARAIAGGQRGVLDSLAEGKTDHLTGHEKRDVNAAIKKGWVEKHGHVYLITDDGKAALEGDKARTAKKAAPAKPAAPAPAKPDVPADTPKPPPVAADKGAPSGDFAHRAVGKDLFAADSAGLAKTMIAKRDQQQAADRGLAVIGAEQGFDGKPRIVPKAELEKLIKDGHPEIFRGVKKTKDGSKTAAQVHEEMRTGNAHYGLGIYGNGYYWGGEDHASDFADETPGSMARGVLDTNAKVVPFWGQLYPEHQAFMESLKGRPDEAEMRDAYEDVGRYAAARGYDAIFVDADKGPTWYNVLNRTAMVMEEGGK